MSKQEILNGESLFQNDEGLFQEVCRRLVQREVVYCVSTLIAGLHEVAERMDDYETYLNLMFRRDYNEPAWEYVFKTADQAELEAVADEFGDSADCEEWLEAHPDEMDNLRDRVWRLIGDKPERLCEFADLDPDEAEAHQHWIVSDWLANELRGHGHSVEEYLGLTIWGRPTAGQSIWLDGVICDIVRSLDGSHWLFTDA